MSAASAAFFMAVATMTPSFTMMAATLTATCEMLDQLLYFFLSSLTVLTQKPSEVQSLTSQWVVGVNGNTVFLDLYHLGHELMVLVVHKSDNGTLEDVIVIEMTVNGKYLAANLVNTLSYILAECLSRSQLEIKVAALFKTLYLLLESIECYAESGDKLKWTVITSLRRNLRQVSSKA